MFVVLVCAVEIQDVCIIQVLFSLLINMDIVPHPTAFGYGSSHARQVALDCGSAADQLITTRNLHVNLLLVILL